MIEGVFGDVLILLAAAVLVVALFRRFNLPPILAYLTVGVIIGQQSLGGMSVSEDTHFLAELGVVFLMFSIGLEFSLPRLLSMKGVVLGLGGAQVVISTAVGALVALALGMPAEGALVVGGLLAMSSTAIVGKQLAEQMEIHSRHGRYAMGMLLFQDLAVIPFLVVIPTLAISDSGSTAMPLLWALAKGVLVSALLLAAGHWLLRPLFREVAARHSTELFMLTVLLVTLAAAWATQQAGLSLVLGAFLAGMMLGETEFRHQVEADIRPFQDVLLGLFFITIGMRLDITVLPDIWFWALLVTAGLVLFKTVLITRLTRMAGAEHGVALRSGLVLAHSGEFSFVLLALALDYGLMDGHAAQIVLAAVLLSMASSPLLIRYNGALAKRVYRRSYGHSRMQMEEAISVSTRSMTQHIIICGYGRVGQNIARQLEQEGFEFVALDMDPLRVREAREAGDAVNYGDSTRQGMLEAAGLGSARALIISFQDIAASLKILGHVRRLRPELPVLVRTRDDADLERLQEAGATEVVPETFEASLMLASHLLLILGVPMSKIVRRMREVHNDRYRLLRGFFPGADQAAMGSPEAQRERLHTVALEEGAFGVGRTLGDLGLDKLGVVVTAVRRSGIRGMAPEPATQLREGDVLVLYGTPPDIERAEEVLLKG